MIGRRRAFASIVALVLLGTLAIPAGSLAIQGVVLSEGHIDAFQPKLEEGSLVLYLHDDTASQLGSLNPAEVLLLITDTAHLTIPENPLSSFLGSPGESVWILPQVQKAGVPWPGLSTEALDGQWQGNQVHFRLLSVTTPPGGRFFLYEISSELQVNHLWRSDDLASGAFSVPLNVHAHMNWAFTRPGAYTLHVEVCGDHLGPGAALGRLCSGPVTYSILVESNLAAPSPGLPPEPSPTPPSARETTTAPATEVPAITPDGSSPTTATLPPSAERTPKDEPSQWDLTLLWCVVVAGLGVLGWVVFRRLRAQP